MGFKEDLQRLSAQISERVSHVGNEETAKQVLIMPFIQALGFDVFNPLEVKPEYIADFGKKKGEKVDYALFKDGKPVMFIEAKSAGEILENHDAQLARYFNATPEVRIAILTNGITYKFFTDLNQNNMMDASPFLTVDITNLSSADIEILGNFKKDGFDTDNMVRYAEELIYTSNLNIKLKDLFKNPPDDFIRYLVKDFSDTRITSNVLERFRPIVKKSISLAILEIVSQGLFPQDATVTEEQFSLGQPSDEAQIAKQTISQGNEKKAVTTEEELASFELIKAILKRHGKDVSTVDAKDRLSYFAVYVRNMNHWFIRLSLHGTHKSLVTRLPLEKVQPLIHDLKAEPAPKGMGESRIYINSVSDLEELEGLITASFDLALTDKETD